MEFDTDLPKTVHSVEDPPCGNTGHSARDFHLQKDGALSQRLTCRKTGHTVKDGAHSQRLSLLLKDAALSHRNAVPEERASEREEHRLTQALTHRTPAATEDRRAPDIGSNRRQKRTGHRQQQKRTGHRQQQKTEEDRTSAATEDRRGPDIGSNRRAPDIGSNRRQKST